MEKIIHTLDQKLHAAGTHKKVVQTFKKLCTDEERVKYTLYLMSTYDIIPQVHYDVKNDKKSEELRTVGNKVFVSKPLTSLTCFTTLKLYTQSIAHAPCSSEQLALAYANRSAVLFKLHKYEVCIKDIDRALVLPYPDNLRCKLNARKNECLKALQEQTLFTNNTDKSKLNGKPCSFEIKTYNSEIPCASDTISVAYSKDYGRHVVAARDINIGETIVLEKAYSTLLNTNNLHTHCSHCLKVCWANIPCNSCTYAMYCSEECRAEEWEKYHDVECAVFPSLLNMDFLKMDLFALRIAVQAVRESSIDALRKELVEVDSHNDPRTKGFSKNGTFESDRYRSVLSLVTNTEKRQIYDLIRRSLDSCFILYFLATCTNMFGPLKNDLSLLRMNPDVTFFGGLLLRHEQMIPSNCHTSIELQGLNENEHSIFLLPFCSLMNHNCSPNIMRFSRDKGVVVVAIFPIKAGEQIFDNYGQLHAVTPKADRQKQLLEQFKFICNCLMCQEDWPTYYNAKSYEHFVKNSQDEINIIQERKQLIQYINILYEGNEADYSHILSNIIRILKLLCSLIPIHSIDICNAVEVMKQIYHLHGNKFELPEL